MFGAGPGGGGATGRWALRFAMVAAGVVVDAAAMGVGRAEGSDGEFDTSAGGREPAGHGEVAAADGFGGHKRFAVSLSVDAVFGSVWGVSCRSRRCGRSSGTDCER